MEVVLSFDGGEDMGKSKRRDILPDDLDGNVDYGEVMDYFPG